MKLLMVGDIVGGPGRMAMARVATRYKAEGRADVVVAFDQLPADLPPPTHDWSDFPSFNEDYATARSELDVRLARLLDDLRRWRPISAAAVS